MLDLSISKSLVLMELCQTKQNIKYYREIKDLDRMVRWLNHGKVLENEMEMLQAAERYGEP